MTSNTSKLLNQQIYVGLHGLRKAFVKPQFYLFLLQVDTFFLVSHSFKFSCSAVEWFKITPSARYQQSTL